MKEHKSVKFVLHKDKTLISKKGRSIEFKKGEPIHVPPELYEEALALGAVPESELPEAKKPETREPENVDDRKVMIMTTFEKLATLNRRDDFTANGAPQLKVLERELGFPIDGKERDALWVEFQQLAEND